jgi:hypothetical protein
MVFIVPYAGWAIGNLYGYSFILSHILEKIIRKLFNLSAS